MFPQGPAADLEESRAGAALLLAEEFEQSVSAVMLVPLGLLCAECGETSEPADLLAGEWAADQPTMMASVTGPGLDDREVAAPHPWPRSPDEVPRIHRSRRHRIFCGRR